VTIASGGVLPNIHAVHMPKKGAGEKDDKAPKVTKENAADKEAPAGARTAMCGRTTTNLSTIFPNRGCPVCRWRITCGADPRNLARGAHAAERHLRLTGTVPGRAAPGALARAGTPRLPEKETHRWISARCSI
jgi:hypothetical protein